MGCLNSFLNLVNKELITSHELPNSSYKDDVPNQHIVS